jgi:hypothetical protein
MVSIQQKEKKLQNGERGATHVMKHKILFFSKW